MCNAIIEDINIKTIHFYFLNLTSLMFMYIISFYFKPQIFWRGAIGVIYRL